MFRHRELNNSPTIACHHRFERRKRLLEMANQPPIAMLVEDYPIGRCYVNLGELFTQGWKFSLLAGMEELNKRDPEFDAEGRKRRMTLNPIPETTVHTT
jgi:hypothetical protein